MSELGFKDIWQLCYYLFLNKKQVILRLHSSFPVWGTHRKGIANIGPWAKISKKTRTLQGETLWRDCIFLSFGVIELVPMGFECPYKTFDTASKWHYIYITIKWPYFTISSEIRTVLMLWTLPPLKFFLLLAFCLL